MPDPNILDDARRRTLRAEHAARINRVIDHVESNLAGDLSLNALAAVAAFSPFHFLRVFKDVVGESPTTFVRRRRVEKAATLLLANPARPITRLALECGFSSPAAFGKVFNEAFGMSASEWLRSGGAVDRKNDATQSNVDEALRRLREEPIPVERMLDPITRNWSWRLAMETGEAKIEVRDVADMSVAYLRHIGPYMGDSALFGRMFGQLFSWAGPRGLLGPQTKAISVYDDSPCITDPEKLRLDVAVTVPAGTAPEGEIGMRTIPGGRYAVGYFEITAGQYGAAWDAMGQWLPESGYEAGDGPCLEAYLNDPGPEPDAKHKVEIYIPVKPQ